MAYRGPDPELRTVDDALFDYERSLVEWYPDDDRTNDAIWQLELLVTPLLGRWRVRDVDEFALAGLARILNAYTYDAPRVLQLLAHALVWEGADRLSVELSLGLRTRGVRDDG